MAHRVETERRGERTVYKLIDDASGASAAILPSFGFNLFDLRLPVGDRVQRVVVAAPDWADRPGNPGRNGIPVLFPFPNRIKAGRYTFGGKDYQLPINSGPHAIHGFAIQAPWDVVEHKVTDAGASITGYYQISKQTPEMRKHWPSDAILTMTYTLSGRRLTLDVAVTNPTAEDLPFGFGIHPYFRLPLGPTGDLAHTAVIVPASESWALSDLVPTGERKPVDERLDFRKGQPIRDLKLDDVLTGLAYDGDRGVCRLVDRDNRAEFRLSFDRHFREVVLYTPPGDPGVISIEPYTQTTDAINLQARGIDAGLRVLKHDQSARMSLAMETVG